MPALRGAVDVWNSNKIRHVKIRGSGSDVGDSVLTVDVVDVESFFSAVDGDSHTEIVLHRQDFSPI